jgi:hypothetical protein
MVLLADSRCACANAPWLVALPEPQPVDAPGGAALPVSRARPCDGGCNAAAPMPPSPRCAAPSRVVVKVYFKSAMQPRHRLNVAREVALLTRLRAASAPGVVRLLRVGEGTANVYLTFEACEGGDLYTRLRNGSCAARGESALCQEVRQTPGRVIVASGFLARSDHSACIDYACER